MHRFAGTRLVFVLLLSLWPTAGVAGEAGLRILPPQGCVPADGGPAVRVHAVVWGAGSGKGTLRLHSDQGRFERVEPMEGGLFRAMYVPPARKKPGSATWAGEWTCGKQRVRTVQKVSLCPRPVGTVQVKAEPARLLAGEGQQAALHIRVADPQGTPLSGQPLQITTNVGRIDLFRDLGDGSYRAVFLPPDDPHPQVAIVMVANPAAARLDRVAVGRAVIPITARIELPGKTAPYTRMNMVVAGRRFGPVTADNRGHFKIPILVPPGYGTGRATSIDRAGNRKTRRVELYLPETNQLGLWGYPRELPADGRARSRLLVTTIDRFGKPTDIGGVVVSARAGKVGAVRDIGSGFYEAYYRAPSSTGAGRDQLVVTFPRGGKRSRAELEVRLLPGPAARVELDAPELLVADGKTTGRVEVTVLDGRDNTVPGQQVEVRATQGRVGPTTEKSTGRHQASLVVGPDPSRWSSDLHAVVRDLPGQEPHRIMVAPASLQGGPGAEAALEVALVDSTGRPVAGQTITLVEAKKTKKTNKYGRVHFSLAASGERDATGGPREVNLAAADGRVRRRVFWMPTPEGPRLLDLGLDPALPPDVPLSARTTVTLHPPPALAIELSADPPTGSDRSWLVRARIAADGEPVQGRKVVFQATTGSLGEVREVQPGTYQVTFQPGPSGWTRAIVTAVESGTHVGAVLAIEEQGSGRPR